MDTPRSGDIVAWSEGLMRVYVVWNDSVHRFPPPAPYTIVASREAIYRLYDNKLQLTGNLSTIPFGRKPVWIK